MREPEPPTILVVSHTHWDREWYNSAARFRQRLIPLVDELLARTPDEPPFLLDGQAVILEDYLAVRPSAREAVANALRRGQLEAGPWYVLADELIPTGESLVRNLLAGRRVLAELAGVEPPPVLYSPDAFGHPAALPLLAAEFGFPLIVTWRGLGGPLWPDGDTFRWVAADGSGAVVHHLPPDGYEFGSTLPSTPREARARWASITEHAVARNRLGVVLLMNGADHHAPQRDLASAVAALRSVSGEALVRRTGLRAAAREMSARAEALELPVIQGELRASFGYTWSLQGTFAVRAPLKQRARAAERMLTRDVEPWLAIARTSDAVPAQALEQAAWTTLLRCHPHDTLCGCSIDAVARAMAARLDSAEAQADGLRTEALHALVGHDADAAAAAHDAWRAAVIIRNRAPRPRSGVAELELTEFVSDVPVGPGSAFIEVPDAPEQRSALGGGAVAYQQLKVTTRVDRLEPRRGYPDADRVRVRRVVAWVERVPAYGLTPLALTAGTATTPSGDVRVEEHADGRLTLENEHLRLVVEPDRTLTLEERCGRVVRRALQLEDVGDAGDTYTPSLTGEVLRFSAAAASRILHAGPLRGAIDLAFTLPIPDRSTREGRSPSPVTVPVTVTCVLDAGAPFVRFRIRGVNTARDHRLRVVLDGGTGPGDVWADAAFGPVRRTRRAVPRELTEREHPLPTDPLHRYVTVAGATAGATVYSGGPGEYEALDDGRIAVTMFRAVGALSRPDLPERPGHAGWPSDTPEAQCLGPFSGELAVMLHGMREDREIDRIERTADDVLLPLTGHTIRQLVRPAPEVHGVELDGEGLAFGACKRSEDGAWMVLRCVNLLARETTGVWRLGAPPREVRRSRLDERPGELIAASGNEVPVRVPARGVLTLLVR